MDLIKLYDDLTQIRVMIDDPNVPENVRKGKQKLTNLRKSIMEQIQKNAISEVRIIRTLGQDEYQEIVDEIRIAISLVDELFKEAKESNFDPVQGLKFMEDNRSRILGQLGKALEKLGEDH